MSAELLVPLLPLLRSLIIHPLCKSPVFCLNQATNPHYAVEQACALPHVSSLVCDGALFCLSCILPVTLPVSLTFLLRTRGLTCAGLLLCLSPHCPMYTCMVRRANFFISHIAPKTQHSAPYRGGIKWIFNEICTHRRYTYTYSKVSLIKANQQVEIF